MRDADCVLYQWIVLLSGSLIFYGFASPYYLIFLFISAISAYACGGLLETDRSKKYVVIAVVINIGILAVLKYTGFFTEIINSIFKTDIPYLRFMLPLGISFYTFMIVS